MNDKEFKDEYNHIVERALSFSSKAQTEGLLALDELIDEKKYMQRDIFEFGIRLVTDGTYPATLERILTNIINLETENDQKVLKNIQKEAVLGIQDGANPRMLTVLLNSYVNFGIEDAMKKYSEIGG